MVLHVLLYYLTAVVTQISTCAETELDLNKYTIPDYTQLSYEQREEYAPNEIGKKLFKIMYEKKTNIAAALDIGSLDQIISIASLIGPHICLLKIHSDTLRDFFSPDSKGYCFWSSSLGKLLPGEMVKIYTLRKIAKEMNFLIMEDRKFADIGSVVEQQYTGGLLQIARWADLVTAHSLAGPGMIEAMQDALKKADITDPRGVVILPQMSTKDNLLTQEYTLNTLMQIMKLKESRNQLPTGLITRSKISFNNENFDYGMLHMTPGIGLSENTNKDQQYITPQKAFGQMGTDIAIIGRALYNSNNPVQETEQFKQICWNEYMNRINT